MWSTQRCVEQSRDLIARLRHSTQQLQEHTCARRRLCQRARTLNAEAAALVAEIRLYHDALAFHDRAKRDEALSEPAPGADLVVTEAGGFSGLNR